MPEPDKISEEAAMQYDQQCRQMEWHGHEALFGMMFEHVLPGEAILDLGTGTGLIAALFLKAGLDVYGMDTSEEMLEVCRWKNTAMELSIGDISQPDWPYDDERFSHLTCCGVFHFLSNRELDTVFSETHRVLKTDGMFGFTVKGIIEGKTEYVDSESRTRIYCLSETKVEELAAGHGFEVLKKMPYWTFNDLERKERSVFYLYVTKKVR
jgi:ubiquinone/menaquinone biosynthesis C-methylase UbiE